MSFHHQQQPEQEEEYMIEEFSDNLTTSLLHIIKDGQASQQQRITHGQGIGIVSASFSKIRDFLDTITATATATKIHDKSKDGNNSTYQLTTCINNIHVAYQSSFKKSSFKMKNQLMKWNMQTGMTHYGDIREYSLQIQEKGDNKNNNNNNVSVGMYEGRIPNISVVSTNFFSILMDKTMYPVLCKYLFQHLPPSITIKNAYIKSQSKLVHWDGIRCTSRFKDENQNNLTMVQIKKLMETIRNNSKEENNDINTKREENNTYTNLITTNNTYFTISEITLGPSRENIKTSKSQTNQENDVSLSVLHYIEIHDDDKTLDSITKEVETLSKENKSERNKKAHTKEGKPLVTFSMLAFDPLKQDFQQGHHGTAKKDEEKGNIVKNNSFLPFYFHISIDINGNIVAFSSLNKENKTKKNEKNKMESSKMSYSLLSPRNGESFLYFVENLINCCSCVATVPLKFSTGLTKIQNLTLRNIYASNLHNQLIDELDVKSTYFQSTFSQTFVPSSSTNYCATSDSSSDFLNIRNLGYAVSDKSFSDASYSMFQKSLPLQILFPYNSTMGRNASTKETSNHIRQRISQILLKEVCPDYVSTKNFHDDPSLTVEKSSSSSQFGYIVDIKILPSTTLFSCLGVCGSSDLFVHDATFGEFRICGLSTQDKGFNAASMTTKTMSTLPLPHTRHISKTNNSEEKGKYKYPVYTNCATVEENIQPTSISLYISSWERLSQLSFEFKLSKKMKTLYSRFGGNYNGGTSPYIFYTVHILPIDSTAELSRALLFIEQENKLHFDPLSRSLLVYNDQKKKKALNPNVSISNVNTVGIFKSVNHLHEKDVSLFMHLGFKNGHKNSKAAPLVFTLLDYIERQTSPLRRLSAYFFNLINITAAIVWYMLPYLLFAGCILYHFDLPTPEEIMGKIISLNLPVVVSNLLIGLYRIFDQIIYNNFVLRYLYDPLMFRRISSFESLDLYRAQVKSLLLNLLPISFNELDSSCDNSKALKLIEIPTFWTYVVNGIRFFIKILVLYLVDVYTYTSFYATIMTKVNDICKRCHLASTKIHSDYHGTNILKQAKAPHFYSGDKSKRGNSGSESDAKIDSDTFASSTRTFTKQNNLSIASKVISLEGLMNEDINAGKWIVCILVAFKLAILYLLAANSFNVYFYANSIANERKEFYTFIGQYNEDIAISLFQDIKTAAPILFYLFKYNLNGSNINFDSVENLQHPFHNLDTRYDVTQYEMTQSLLPILVSIYTFITFLTSAGLYAFLRQFFSLEGLAVRIIYLLQSKYVNIISVNHVPSNVVNLDNISKYLVSASFSQLVLPQRSEFSKTFSPMQSSFDKTNTSNLLKRRSMYDQKSYSSMVDLKNSYEMTTPIPDEEIDLHIFHDNSVENSSKTEVKEMKNTTGLRNLKLFNSSSDIMTNNTEESNSLSFGEDTHLSLLSSRKFSQESNLERKGWLHQEPSPSFGQYKFIEEQMYQFRATGTIFTKHKKWKEVWLVIDGDELRIQKKVRDNSIVIHYAFPISEINVYSIKTPFRMLRIVHQAFNDKIINYENMFRNDFGEEISEKSDITIELKCTPETTEDEKSAENEEAKIKALMNHIEWNQYIATALKLQSPR